MALEANPGAARPRWMVLRAVGVALGTSDIDAIVAANLLHGKRFEGLFSTEGNVVNGFPQIPEQEIGASGGHSAEAVRDAMVLGSPDEVVEQLEAYAALGVDEFCYGGNYGLDPVRTRQSLELFVERVMPRFVSRRKARVTGAAGMQPYFRRQGSPHRVWRRCRRYVRGGCCVRERSELHGNISLRAEHCSENTMSHLVVPLPIYGWSVLREEDDIMKQSVKSHMATNVETAAQAHSERVSGRDSVDRREDAYEDGVDDDMQGEPGLAYARAETQSAVDVTYAGVSGGDSFVYFFTVPEGREGMAFHDTGFPGDPIGTASADTPESEVRLEGTGRSHRIPTWQRADGNLTDRCRRQRHRRLWPSSRGRPTFASMLLLAMALGLGSSAARAATAYDPPITTLVTNMGQPSSEPPEVSLNSNQTGFAQRFSTATRAGINWKASG